MDAFIPNIPLSVEVTVISALAVSHAFLHWKIRQHDANDTELKKEVKEMHSKLDYICGKLDGNPQV